MIPSVEELRREIEKDLKNPEFRKAYVDLGLKYLEEHPREADVIMRGLVHTAGSLFIHLGKALRSFT